MAADIAREYHEATKHSYISVRSSAHFLDFDNQPIPYKVYEVDLPEVAAEPAPDMGVPTLRALEGPLEERPLTRERLCHLLHYAAGITRVRNYPGGRIAFRAAACTGALYEIDLYVVTGDLEGLAAGVYHYGPHDSRLRRLREGDLRDHLAWGAAGELQDAQAVVLCTGTYWRNAWKYRDRTYRHFGWDNGTILANLLAAACGCGIPARLVMGFVDREADHLLGLPSGQEVTFSAVALGRGSVEPRRRDLEPLDLPTRPLSPHPVDYPLMRRMHRASCLETPQEVAEWRRPVPAASLPPPREEPIALAIGGDPRGEPLEETIRRRGSTREFARLPLEAGQLGLILERATREVPADFLEPGALLNHLYLVIHAVEGIEPGAYYYRRREGTLEPIRRGSFRKEAGYLGLEQALPADCSAAVFFLADLDAVLDRLGPRGYRCVQLEAGLLGGRMYLAAYALGLGASGLTFYDDEAAAFFRPHSHGLETVFLVALGRSARRRR